MQRQVYTASQKQDPQPQIHRPKQPLPQFDYHLHRRNSRCALHAEQILGRFLNVHFFFVFFIAVRLLGVFGLLWVGAGKQQ